MLFRFIRGIDLLNLPVNLTHFTGTAQNKRAFYFSISSDSPTSNKRNEFAEKKNAYMLPKGMHTFAYCNYRVFFEFMGKLITNTSVFMFMCAVKSFPFHRICLNFVHRKTNTFRRVFFFSFPYVYDNHCHRIFRNISVQRCQFRETEKIISFRKVRLLFQILISVSRVSWDKRSSFY